MGDMLQQVGRILLLVGVFLAGVGGMMLTAGKLGLGRLPGDLTFGGKNCRIYLPIGTSIVLSLLLTGLLWLILRLRR